MPERCCKPPLYSSRYDSGSSLCFVEVTAVSNRCASHPLQRVQLVTALRLRASELAAQAYDSNWARAVLLAGVVLGASLAVARAFGDTVRGYALIEIRTAADTASLPFLDSQANAARFVADRSRVTIHVPWAMTKGEFISLYHLANTPGIDSLVEAGFGAKQDTDLIQEGDSLTLHP
jgi:hypothetical protein